MKALMNALLSLLNVNSWSTSPSGSMNVFGYDDLGLGYTPDIDTSFEPSGMDFERR